MAGMASASDTERVHRGTAAISRRVAAVAPSATLAVDAKAKALQAARRSMSSASAPASPTSRPRRTSSRRPSRPAATRATTTTRRPPGSPSCAQAIAAKTARDSGYEVAAAQVLVTNGGKQAVSNAFATLLDPGDEVLVPAPYWTTYPESIALAGGVPVARPDRRVDRLPG